MIDALLDEADDKMDDLQLLLNKIRVENEDSTTVTNTTELQNAVDKLSNKIIKIRPGLYDKLIVRNGIKNLILQADTTGLGNGRVERTMIDAMVQLKSIVFESKAEAYTFKGFQFLPSTPDKEIVGLGADKETDPLNTPNKILFDQCICDADVNVGGKRGMRWNCREVEFRNSRAAGFWYSNDSQAIVTWNGPGPFKVVNSYLEASGENFMSGGATSVNKAMQPDYIEFVGNHCFKPEAWITKPGATEKNLLEFKDIRRANVYNNLLDGSWKDGQVGYAVIFSPRNQYGDEPYTVVENIYFGWNVIRNAGAGIKIVGDDSNAPSLITNNITVQDNLVYGVDPVKYPGSAGFSLFVLRNPIHILVRRNTFLGKNLNSLLTIEDTPVNFQVLNNIFTEGQYGLKTVKGMGYAPFTQVCINSQFAGNAIIPSGVRVIDYGPLNKKDPNAVDVNMKSTILGVGVDIDELRRRVRF